MLNSLKSYIQEAHLYYCRKCDLRACTKLDDNFTILHDASCFPDGQDVCTVCKPWICEAIASLSEQATRSIFNAKDSSNQEEADENGINDNEDENDTCSPDIIALDTPVDSCLQLQQQVFSWGLVPGP